MDSVDIGHEDDSLLRNLPPDDAGRFACSPLVIAGSAGSSRPPKTMLKDNAHVGEIGGILPDSNKENLKESCNMKLGSSNLSMEPQKMKRNQKAGGYNLRKSLAWDKAFFTEEGVLSSLELSMICGTPSKLDGKFLPVISEEHRTPMHANTTPTGLQTFESKSYRKLHSSSTKENKRTGEGSILKQKSLASGSVISKKLASTASAKNSARKEGSCLSNLTPTSTHKRLLSTSPAKPVAQISKIPRMPILKPDAHLSSTIASSSDASHVKRNRIAPTALSSQKHLGQKGCSNTRSTSNAPTIVSQRIPKPSKPSDQRTRKNRTVPSSREQSSTSHKVSNVKVTTSEFNSGKILPVGLEANDGIRKAAVSVHANIGNTCNIGQFVQHQVAKPSGLRMPSPSLRFFSEPNIYMPNSVGQSNIRLGETFKAIQSKIPKATMDRIPDSGPVQPCPVSSISHNLGATWNVIHSKIQKATMEIVSVPGPVQPCSVSSINSPKIHYGPLQCENGELIVNVQALLDEKPLEPISNNCLEEAGKDFVEHGHTSLSTEGVDGKDNRSVSPIGECRYNGTDLFQSSEDQLITHWIDKKSDSHAKQGQNDLPVMSKGRGLESDVQDYAVHTPMGSNCCLGATWNVIHSKIPKATVEIVSVPGPVQLCSVSSINRPKIHDEPVQRENGELIVNVQALLDEKPLEPISNNCLEAVDKDFVEHGHTSLSTEGVDGKDNRSVSPVGECRYNGTDLFQSSEDQLITHWIDKKSDSHAKQGQNDLPVMSKGRGLESEVQDYAVHTPMGSKCCLEMPYRLNGYKEVQELQCPSHVTVEVSQVYDGLSSNIEDLSFSPKRTFEIDAIKSIMAKDEVYNPLVVRETLSASLEKIADTTNKQQELQVLQRSLPLMERPVQSADGSIVEDDAFRIVTDEDKVSEPLTLEGALSASLDTKPQAEEHLDLSVAEYTNETDLTGQNADFELHMSPRSCKCTSQVDAVICDVELSLSQAQGLDSTAAELSTFEIDQQLIISNELVREYLPDEATSASLKSKLPSKDLVACEDIHDNDNEDEKTISRIVKDGKNQSLLVIRPPADVAPFSDEWLAAVEAAGEDILTLKTGPVQNSPPAKISPEPSPWSPVKRKNNQGIGPYDCTKYSTGQL